MTTTNGLWTGADLQGSYYGLVYEEEGLEPRSAGFIRIRTGKDRRFRGRIYRWSRKYPLRGRFNRTGYAEETVYGVAKDELPDDVPPDTRDKEGRIFLTLDPVQGALTGDFKFRGNSPGYLAVVDACRIPRKEDRPEMVPVGRYAMSLRGTASQPEHLGTGYATMRITSKGRAQVIGSLPDGVKFSWGTAVCESLSVPVYDRIQQRVAAIMGWVDMDLENPERDLEGTLYWMGPQSRKNLDAPLKFFEPMDIDGSIYLRPGPGETMLSWTDGWLELVVTPEGSTIRNRVRWDENNKLEPVGDGIEDLKLSVQESTGVFKGTFRHPDTGKKTKLSGVILQKQDWGRGFYRGHGVNGEAWLVNEGL